LRAVEIILAMPAEGCMDYSQPTKTKPSAATVLQGLHIFQLNM